MKSLLGPSPRRHLLIKSVAGLSLLLAQCTPGTSPDLSEEHAGHAESEDLLELTPEMLSRAGIRIEKSRQVELQTVLETTGGVSPNETRVAHIRPFSEGVIERVYVRRGDRVTAKQPLVLYDNIELGELIGEFLSLHAQLQKDLAQLEVGRKFWERAVQLLEVQAIAEKEVELREAELKNAQAMEQSRRAEISRIEEKLHRFGLSDADLEELGSAHHEGPAIHRTKSHNTLQAPFSGVVISYDVAEGELVGPDRQLLTLADVSTVWVLADIYEKDLGLVTESTPVEIRSVAYPKRVFEGRLTYISDVLDPVTRTAKARCVVPNADGALKLEMFVTISIPSRGREVAVGVPESAIQNIDGQDCVFVDMGNNRFQRQLVTSGNSSGGWIGVEGIEEGTRVVTEGSFHLKSILKREAIGDEH